jgi:hypothetical protein
VSNPRRFSILALLLFGLLAMGADSCSSTDETGTNASQKSSGPFADADIRGSCPSVVTIGIPVRINMQVRNTGREDWPVTFLTFTDGSDHFTFDSIHQGALVGQKADTPGFDTYRFGTGAGLGAGEQGRIEMVLAPKEAGNTKLSFGAWGGQADEQFIPDDIRLVSCDVAINP